MNVDRDANLDRLSDLLADRATQRLSAAEAAELIALLASCPDVDEHAFDRAAAAVDLSADVSPAGPDVESSGPMTAPRKPRGAISWLPWLAAAAGLALAVLSWWPSRGAAPLAAQRAALLSRSGVTGDVVWNGRQQTGFLRISGLAVNDPATFQYQLWIFDEARRAYSDHVAVDGGVFDVDRATGDLIVPIHSKLPVARPFLFAVSTEPPGGVVKHNPDRDPDRYRVVLTAPL
jgi:hypothetical protein